MTVRWWISERRRAAGLAFRADGSGQRRIALTAEFQMLDALDRLVKDLGAETGHEMTVDDLVSALTVKEIRKVTRLLRRFLDTKQTA